MKQNKTLYKFIAVILAAIALGVAAGKYAAAEAIEINLVPAGYMQGLMYSAPAFMVVATAGVLACIVKYRKNGTAGKWPQYISIYTYTVLGVIVSGFCGAYTMENFLQVAATVGLGVIVLSVLVLLQDTDVKIHARKYRNSNASLARKAIFWIYGTVVLASAFVPIGILPVMAVGIVWAAIIKASA